MTNSEGQVKYCRCTFFGHATPDRAGARPASNVGSRDVTWASQPTPVIPFGVFWRVSRAPFLRQSGVVTETQFLIGLRVLCGLLCSALSTLGTGGRRFSRSKAGRFAPMDFADLASTPLQSSGSPTPRPLWLWLGRVVAFAALRGSSNSAGYDRAYERFGKYFFPCSDMIGYSHF